MIYWYITIHCTYKRSIVIHLLLCCECLNWEHGEKCVSCRSAWLKILFNIRSMFSGIPAEWHAMQPNVLFLTTWVLVPKENNFKKQQTDEPFASNLQTWIHICVTYEIAQLSKRLSRMSSVWRQTCDYEPCPQTSPDSAASNHSL